jgi:hypothetical protein
VKFVFEEEILNLSCLFELAGFSIGIFGLEINGNGLLLEFRRFFGVFFSDLRLQLLGQGLLISGTVLFLLNRESFSLKSVICQNNGPLKLVTNSKPIIKRLLKVAKGNNGLLPNIAAA